MSGHRERICSILSSNKDQDTKIRIGIDVGGTFTHAVAIDAATLNVVGKSKVPTTHSAAQGVALGIVLALHQLLETTGIAAKDVAFIAHSTTQATNALLEGDLVRVGIIGLSRASDAFVAQRAINLRRVPVADGCFLECEHAFFVVDDKIDVAKIDSALASFKAKGCGAIAVSQAFSVDDPAIENQVAEIARSHGFLATTGSEVSQLYGLKVRTRTAAINAGILPKMIESADLTEKSVREAGITAPIMIMRSDGGVMDIEAMRKRPILSILSGPAAGVAAAMMFLRISDGVFLEVGGTSTDISAIANGRALVRSAQIGGHRVYMRTLDVRTIGVAGGSMSRLDGRSITHVGPRSAHIAGLSYAAFASDFACQYRVKTIRPLPKDPSDYLALEPIAESSGQKTLTITPTCASNFVGLVPEGDACRGDLQKIDTAFGVLADHFGKSGAQAKRELAERILTLAAEQCIPTVKALIQDHKLDAELVKLVGGGGGASAIVPSVARHIKMPYEIAEHADVISAIGVAMALIRETIERQVDNPAQANQIILQMRSEAFDAVHRMGADPATIEVHIEIDAKSSIVRATASGATKLTTGSGKKILDQTERLAVVAKSMRIDQSQMQSAICTICRTEQFEVFASNASASKTKGMFGLNIFADHRMALRVLDSDSIIRLQASDGDACLTSASAAEGTIQGMIDKHAQWGDAGKTIPNIILLIGAKIIDLSGLLDETQVLSLAKAEISNLPSDKQIIVLAKKTL